MTLYLVGIGLYDQKDITLRGLEIVKAADKVYLEHYTSILASSKESLEELYGKSIYVAPRDLVEKEAENKLLLPAKEKDIVLLVVGDVFGATTHTDLFLRAKKLGIKVEVVFNASIMNAIGIVGLELYKYGKTTSIVFPDHDWLPETPYDVIKGNKSLGLHTLCLLDIKVAEPSPEDLRRSLVSSQTAVIQPMPPRFMTVNEGLRVLHLLEEKRGEGVIAKDEYVIGVARVGHPNMRIVAGTFSEVLAVDFGAPLHAIIIPGKLHEIEKESLLLFKD